MNCLHEPWMDAIVPGRARQIGGLFDHKALVCCKCGVLYVPPEKQREIDEGDREFVREREIERAAERAKKGEA